MLKIAFLSPKNPRSRAHFSGTLYYMLKGLENANASVEVLGEKYFEALRQINFVHKVFKRLSRKSQYINHLYVGHLENSMAREIAAQLSNRNFDVIIAPIASRVILNCLPKTTDLKIVYVTDAIPRYIVEEYGRKHSPKYFLNEIETLKRSWLVVYSSKFMLDYAIEEYGNFLNKNNSTFIPFGLNMDSAPTTVLTKSGPGIKLLFVGKYWERKGGDIAYQCLRQLLAKGINAHLTIIGCSPSGLSSNENLLIIPFIDKNEPREQKRYFEILKESHILLLPTRADCTPMVIAEANAFSIPVLTTQVGGIPSLVKDGKNGFLFNIDDSAQEYAEKILEIGSIKESNYLNISKASFLEYRNRLNWDSWAKQMIGKIETSI